MDQTIREYVTRRVRWTWSIALACWLLFPLSSQFKEKFSWLAFVGVIGFGGAMISMLWIKCPRCSVRLGQSIAGALGVPFLKPQPNFCPYCGVSLDEPRTKPAEHSRETPYNPIR